jgi:hypothetical protein
MNKIFKYTSVLVLWLAWLVMTAHMIIPHDHHVIESVTGNGDSCPLSNNKSDHHSGFPVHCHAFNDLTSEKARPYLLNLNIQFNIAVITSNDSPIFEFPLDYIKTIDDQINRPVSYFLKLSLLRAPPALV